ncbi:MAG: UDP-2,4-diacetamido-2,4,6-trideoxy-beta-L-altropyranose hydrolase [Bacteroidales bacterium]|nr:UDP-2,4-diacetamido-2,4,6-trideoxy-beta-L-altropyranose hydrolase [Bacteroidales bacterium]
MKVLFRLNAGMVAGLGHLIRCLLLGDAFNKKNIDSYFLIKTDNQEMIHSFLKDEEIIKQNYKTLQGELTKEEDVEIIKNNYYNNFSFLILDHYDHDIIYQEKLKRHGIKWAQFDFEAKNKILANVVINANISANENDYKKITNQNTGLCIGYKYAIIRQSFSNLKSNPAKNRILIAMGGGTYPADVIQLIELLITNKDFQFEIVTRDEQLVHIAYDQANVNLHLNTADVIPIYQKCEVAIVAGGVTTFELAALNTPMLIIPFAENQIPNAKAWGKFNFALSYENVKSFEITLGKNGLNNLIELLNNKSKKRRINIDTLGPERIVLKIFKQLEYEQRK